MAGRHSGCELSIYLNSGWLEIAVNDTIESMTIFKDKMNCFFSPRCLFKATASIYTCLGVPKKIKDYFSESFNTSWRSRAWETRFALQKQALLLTRVRGDGVDVGCSDDTHPGPPVILHAHADAYGNPCNDPHDEHNSKHDASNCSAPGKGDKSTSDSKVWKGLSLTCFFTVVLEGECFVYLRDILEWITKMVSCIRLYRLKTCTESLYSTLDKLTVQILVLKFHKFGARERVQQLRLHTTLLGDLDLAPNIQ